MINIEKAIVIIVIWIVCGFYSHSKQNGDTLIGAAILTLLLS